MGKRCNVTRGAQVRSVIAVRRILFVRSLVHHQPQLSLFIIGEFPSVRRLRLEKGSEKDAVVEFGADAAEIAIVQLLAHPLGLEYLGFAFAAALAEHVLV